MTLTVEDYSKFSNLAYQRNDQTSLDILSDYEDSGWEVFKTNGGVNGFQAIALGKDTNNDGIYDEVVIAYAGTNSALDIAWDDMLIAIQIEPTQANGARTFYNQTIGNSLVSSTANIYITGHSLGGSLAQIVAAEKNKECVTFNAPGMKHKVPGTYNNITNYVNINDWVGSYKEHVGNTYFYFQDGITSNGNYSPHSKYMNENDYYTNNNVNITDSEWKVDYF